MRHPGGGVGWIVGYISWCSKQTVGLEIKIRKVTCHLKPWEWLRYLGSQCKERSAWFLEGGKGSRAQVGFILDK